MLKADAPHALRDCHSYVEKLQDVADELPLAGATQRDSYRRLWLIRCWIIHSLRSQGHPRLVVGNDAVKHIAKTFPDSNEHLPALLGAQRGRWCARSPLGRKLRKLSYSDAPEYLSMHACLFFDTTVTSLLRGKPAGWLTKHRQGLVDMRDAYYRKHGVYPHPAVLLAMFPPSHA